MWVCGCVGCARGWGWGFRSGVRSGWGGAPSAKCVALALAQAVAPPHRVRSFMTLYMCLFCASSASISARVARECLTLVFPSLFICCR